MSYFEYPTVKVQLDDVKREFFSLKIRMEFATFLSIAFCMSQTNHIKYRHLEEIFHGRYWEILNF